MSNGKFHKSGDVVSFFIPTNHTQARALTDDEDLVLYDVNIHIRNAAVFYGEGTLVQAAVLNTSSGVAPRADSNAVIYYNQPIRLKTLFFKSYVSGTVAYVTCAGVIK